MIRYDDSYSLDDVRSAASLDPKRIKPDDLIPKPPYRAPVVDWEEFLGSVIWADIRSALDALIVIKKEEQLEARTWEQSLVAQSERRALERMRGLPGAILQELEIYHEARKREENDGN